MRPSGRRRAPSTPACRTRGRARRCCPARCSPRRSTCRGETDAAPYGYGRDGNPTWTALEARARRARGRRGASSSPRAWRRCARVAAEPALRPGDVLVAVRRRLSRRARRGRGAARAARRRGALRADRHRGDRAAADGAALVWIETPSNPRLDVCDIAAVAEAAHAAGRAAWRSTTRSHARSASGRSTWARTSSMTARPRRSSGHSDLLLGAVCVRDAELAAALRAGARRAARSRARSRRGSRTARSPRSRCGWSARSANALALAAALRARADVLEVRHPVASTHGRGARCATPAARRLRARERGARAALPRRAASWWPRRPASAACTRPPSGARAGAPTTCREGFIRFSAGIEDAADLRGRRRAGARREPEGPAEGGRAPRALGRRMAGGQSAAASWAPGGG